MNILVVSNVSPSRHATGLRRRLAHILDGLTSLGDVDLFSIVDHYWSTPPPSDPQIHVRRSHETTRPLVTTLPRRGGLPNEFATRDYASLRQEFVGWVMPPYDVVWFSRVEGYLMLNDVISSPALVVDLDDLEYRKLFEQWRNQSDLSRRKLREHRQDVIEIARWWKLEQRVARSADRVAVCSEADVKLLHWAKAKAHVIPNGYEVVKPVGRNRVSVTPSITFIGHLKYGPNIDAVHSLINEIGPIIRRTVPNVRFRLVGSADAKVAALHDPPNVTVTGWVDDLREELLRADLIVVPIRYGGGTRTKILEAFAYKIPVVSTKLGAEGLGTIHGQHLLIGETSNEIASQAIRLLFDQDLRSHLANKAYALFSNEFRISNTVSNTVALVQDLLSQPTPDVTG